MRTYALLLFTSLSLKFVSPPNITVVDSDISCIFLSTCFSWFIRSWAWPLVLSRWEVIRQSSLPDMVACQRNMVQSKTHNMGCWALQFHSLFITSQSTHIHQILPPCFLNCNPFHHHPKYRFKSLMCSVWMPRDKKQESADHLNFAWNNYFDS